MALNIAIIDADLIGRNKHRFPNLACMKISGYYKENGDQVTLIYDYKNLYYNENIWNDYQNALKKYLKNQTSNNSDVLALKMSPCFKEENIRYDKILISKVFTDTEIDSDFLNMGIVEYGGTGFYFDKAPNLPYKIEHNMPDYHLYDNWICDQAEKEKIKSHIQEKYFDEKAFMSQFKEYTDYSIGFITRGCFRKCEFCVNKKYDHVFMSSNLSEFYDQDRNKICLLDDNFLGFKDWRVYLDELIRTGKPFKFKQGLDERLLTDEKCELLFNSKYDGDLTFAFDKISDYELIHKKLELIRKHTDKTNIKFYVLCGFESTDEKDIENTFKRVELLTRYHCLSYIMRYQNKNSTPWKDSRFRGMYITLARWCNQPSFLKKKSFREFCYMKGNKAALRYMTNFESEFPNIAEKYFDNRWK